MTALDGRTRLISLSFVEFASGFRNDLDAVGALCRERGIRFFVDAIQGLGTMPIDVKALRIDVLAADGGHGPRFTEKALPGSGVLGKLPLHHLERDRPHEV